MILEHVHVAGLKGKKGIQIKDGLIAKVIDGTGTYTMQGNELRIDCKGALAFPGFINSHDHLDFNLYPALKNKTYTSYTEWGNDIHHQNKEVIGQVQKIPQDLRVQWGIYKNLLNGITTVVNHGRIPTVNDDLITVYQNCYDLHSPRFEKNWKLKLNRLFRGDKPFVIHLGEGIDADAENEINDVAQANFFKRKIIAVHGVAMTEQQAASFAGLIWCPYSNFFLLGKTCDTANLKNRILVVFGSDSTLTSSWNIWDHFRCGLKTGMVSAQELTDMLTLNPAKLWGLETNGRIAEKYNADIVIAQAKSSKQEMGELFSLEPEDILMVLHRGNIRVADERIMDRLPDNVLDKSKFSYIQINDTKKYVQGDLNGLVENIRKIYPDVTMPFTLL